MRRKFEGPLKPMDEKTHHTTDLSLKDYCNMQNKHLKAYLKGETRFLYKGEWYDVEFKFEKDV